jgi:arsenite methyltransferase
MPVDDASVDAVTSNCVINLVPDKARVFREIARVLRPGGRFVISDVVLDGRLPDALVRDVTAYVGCVSGAMQREEYLDTVRAAGLTDVEILKDVDFLAAVGDTLPEEINVMAESSGVRPEDVAGRVRSITFRAVKR